MRLAAAEQMLRSLDDASLALLRGRVGVETNAEVKEEIETGLALAALDSTDSQARLDAIATLGHMLRPQVRNRLAGMLEKTADGSFVERDEKVRRAAGDAVRGIDRSRVFYGGIETLFFGLSVGSVLVLVATGLAITSASWASSHGARRADDAGGVPTYGAARDAEAYPGSRFWWRFQRRLSSPVSPGVILERTIIRFLHGRPLETLLATFGVSLVLRQFVRSIFSANNRSVETPAWMSGTLQLNGALSITYNRLYILIFTLIVFAILLAVFRRTRLGLDIRAVSQNRAMAQAMGIRTEWVDAMTFGLGSGLAGIAGVALSQFTNVGPNLGQSYIVDSFMVVVFGGVGSLWGTLVGGMSMGVVNQLLEPYAGAVLAKIFVLVALILFIQRWPRGLFPQTGRAAESQ